MWPKQKAVINTTNPCSPHIHINWCSTKMFLTHCTQDWSRHCSMGPNLWLFLFRQVVLVAAANWNWSIRGKLLRIVAIQAEAHCRKAYSWNCCTSSSSFVLAVIFCEKIHFDKGSRLFFSTPNHQLIYSYKLSQVPPRAIYFREIIGCTANFSFDIIRI